MTSGKLKSMMQPIGSLADSAFDNIEEIIKESPEIDVKPIFQGLTLDVIVRTTLGLNTNCRLGKDMDFFHLISKASINFNTTNNYVKALFFNILMLFPELWVKMGVWSESARRLRKSIAKYLI